MISIYREYHINTYKGGQNRPRKARLCLRYTMFIYFLSCMFNKKTVSIPASYS